VPGDVTIRPARPTDTAAIRGVLDATLLASPPSLDRLVAEGNALVALTDDRDTVVGTLVSTAPAVSPDTDLVVRAFGGESVDDSGPSATPESRDSSCVDCLPPAWRERSGATHVETIAVRPRRQAEGVGTALVRAADATTDGPLTATFRPAVRPFYERLGFEITAVTAPVPAVEGRTGQSAEDQRGRSAEDDHTTERRLVGLLPVSESDDDAVS
jgi:GNAT superfamily N-acetyltransferase